MVSWRFCPGFIFPPTSKVHEFVNFGNYRLRSKAGQGSVEDHEGDGLVRECQSDGVGGGAVQGGFPPVVKHDAGGLPDETF